MISHSRLYMIWTDSRIFILQELEKICNPIINKKKPKPKEEPPVVPEVKKDSTECPTEKEGEKKSDEEKNEVPEEKTGAPAKPTNVKEDMDLD